MNARTPIELKVEYKRLNTFFYDYTKNISRGGTFIRTSRPLPVGTSFVFKLFVPTLAEPLVLTAEVEGIRGEERAGGEVADDPDAGMAIRFVFADEGERDALDRMAYELMASSLGPHITEELRHITDGEPQEHAGEGLGAHFKG